LFRVQDSIRQSSGLAK